MSPRDTVVPNDSVAMGTRQAKIQYFRSWISSARGSRRSLPHSHERSIPRGRTVHPGGSVFLSTDPLRTAHKGAFVVRIDNDPPNDEIFLVFLLDQ